MKTAQQQLRNSEPSLLSQLQQRQQLLERGVPGLQCLLKLEEHARRKFDGKAVDNGQVSLEDRAKLASALHAELARLKGNKELWKQPYSGSALMTLAGLHDGDRSNASKTINAYACNCYSGTPDRNDRQRKKVNAKAEKFARFIRALLQFTTENPETVCSRIFAGTSFRGLEADVNECRRLDAVLASTVGRVNRMLAATRGKKSLQSVFDETAEAKTRLQARGSYIDWPFFNREPDAETEADSGQSALRSAYWETDLAYGQQPADRATSVEEFTALPLDWYAAILNLPRAYLGCAVYLPYWDVAGTDRAAREEIYLAEIDAAAREIFEVRMLKDARQSLAWSGQKAGDLAIGSSGLLKDPTTRERRMLEGQGDCWLTIYPDPSGNGLCPMLYWPQGEDGVHVCVLNERTIRLLDQINVSGKHPGQLATLFSCLQNLLADGGTSLEIEWSRTAFDLLTNPVLKASRTKDGSPGHA